MKNYIENIELINKYLKKELSEKEISNFENLLKTDSNFNTLFEEHSTFLGGLKRQQLKAEIVKAKQTYIKVKWMKFLGISIVVLAVATVVYFTVSNKSIEPIQNKKLENNSVIVDTIQRKKPIETSTEINNSIILKDSFSSKKRVTKGALLKPVKNVDTSFKKAPENFKINIQKDTLLVCKEGTKLKIKANSFVDIKGNLINGTIDLNITEYYKLSDMLLANLSTTSNGEQLETGGMLFIEAKQDETNLKLVENSSIEISFPTANKQDGMRMFSGEWKNNIIDWQLQKKTEDTIVEEVEEDIEVPFSIVEEVPIYPGCEGSNQAEKRQCINDAISKFVQENFNPSVAVSLGLEGRLRVNSIFKISKFGKTSFIQSRGTHPIIEQEANRVIALLPQMQPGKQRGKVVTVPYSLPIIFTISEDKQSVSARIGSLAEGNLLFSNQVEMDTIYTSVRGPVELIREVMHDKDFKVDSVFIKTWETYTKSKLIRFYGENNVILRKPLFEMENTKFKILDDDSLSRGGNVIRKRWNESQIPTTSRVMSLSPKQMAYVGKDIVSEEEFTKRLQDEEDTTITIADVNSYVLRTSSLGWINCDRFNRRTKRIKYKLKIKNLNDAVISMVFKTVNSVLPSWKTNGIYDFGTVAENENITLVAIKKQNGKLYLDILDTKTKENPDLKFNFKEVNLGEMKNELQKLNSLF